LIFSVKYDILELFLKNGFDINGTLFFNGVEHNLLSYFLYNVYDINKSNIHILLKYGIDINKKLKNNVDFVNSIFKEECRKIIFFKTIPAYIKDNSILDLLIKENIYNISEYHYSMLFIIFDYYCNIKKIYYY